MKTLIVSSILALGVAGGAVAADTSDLTIGQEALVLTQAGEESYNDRNHFFGNAKIQFAAKDIHSERAAAIFDRLLAESLEDE